MVSEHGALRFTLEEDQEVVRSFRKSDRFEYYLERVVDGRVHTLGVRRHMEDIRGYNLEDPLEWEIRRHYTWS